MPDYNRIFTAHINRILEERGLTKYQLAEMGGVSTAFMTALTRGEGNPTLKTMQAIADGFGIPLPLLLKPLESDEWQTILAVQAFHQPDRPVVPEGYAHVHVILPAKKAAQAEQWARGAQAKLNKKIQAVKE